MKLFDQYNEVINDTLIDRVSAMSDEVNGDGKKAFKAIYVTMVAGLVRRSTSSMSTNMLMSQLKKSLHENIISDYKIEIDTLDKVKTQKFIDLGNKNISQVFPAVKSPLLNLISTWAGTGKKETTNYIGFITSMMMKFLASDVENDKLKVDDFSDFLKSHHEPLFRDTPQEFLDKMIPALGMHELRKIKFNASKKDGNTVDEVEETTHYDHTETSENVGNKFNLKYLWLFLALLLAGLAAFLVFKNKDVIFNETETEVGTAYEEDTLANLETNIVDTIAVADTQAVVVPSDDSDFEQLNSILAPGLVFDGTNNLINFKSLSFEKDITDLGINSNASVQQLSDVLKSNPKTQIQILGCSADGNSQIGLKRAFNLKRALQNNGIAPIRIDAVSHPDLVDNLKIKVINK